MPTGSSTAAGASDLDPSSPGYGRRLLDPWRRGCPEVRDYILPLIFLKRLSDVYEDEIANLAEQFGRLTTARELVARDPGLVRFYLPEECTWPPVSRLTEHIGQRLTETFRRVAQLNPELEGVIDMVDFNAAVSGQRVIDGPAGPPGRAIARATPLGLPTRPRSAP